MFYDYIMRWIFVFFDKVISANIAFNHLSGLFCKFIWIWRYPWMPQLLVCTTMHGLGCGYQSDMATVCDILSLGTGWEKWFYKWRHKRFMAWLESVWLCQLWGGPKKLNCPKFIDCDVPCGSCSLNVEIAVGVSKRTLMFGKLSTLRQKKFKTSFRSSVLRCFWCNWWA